MKLGIIGVGNMAGAILQGGLRAGVLQPEQVIIHDLSEARVDALMSECGVSKAASAQETIRRSECVLLGVHPDQVSEALEGLDLHGKALISIAAGWSTDALHKAAPGARVLRVMPNTPALVFKGMTALSLAHTLSAEEKTFAEQLFGAVGLVEWVEERLMNAVTGLSGSGPAYVFLFMEALADGGVLQGLPRNVAQRMAAQTLLGAATIALEDGRHTAQLKDAVASPGGTTIEAIRALEREGLRSAVIEAVAAAAEKAKRLS